MNRDEMLGRMRDAPGFWDFLVIGGGATGLGVVVDAASRGYRALLLEQSDFAKGTSSRSTKLVHGGVRYLRQGNISLVAEALHERGLLMRNAPHLVRNLSFVVPNYSWWEGPFYGIGLKLYDVLAGKLGLGPSRHLSREETLERIPTLEPDGLIGGVIYHDAQFDDARLAVNLAQTAAELGATLVTYAKVIDLLKAHGVVHGVMARNMETGEEVEVHARVVVNATGAFCDAIRQLDDAEAVSIVAPSQGVHLVLDRSFLPGSSAIMVPHTDDGRVLFAVPWHERVIVGTTDTPIEELSLEPLPLAEEIDFLLTHTARYLTRDPTPSDVLSVFAGVRPLVRQEAGKDTASLSRDHTLIISPSGLVTITGGKWTTYRKMAEDTVNAAALVAGLDERDCVTHQLRIHGWLKGAPGEAAWEVYGSDGPDLERLATERPELRELVHPRLPYRANEVVWGVRHEMARTVEDVLARRTRALLLDARASIEAAPSVARLMAREMGRDRQWEEAQIADYRRLARGYLLDA
ncbi:MAG: glycerol-3-phosphate dehydrogenase/oxidase [Gemmatimonadetes bacterium]|nr:glycerol-3-phosphate dehydrogenase/oxidase [Gemmatimonadota bacterium]